MIATDTDGPTPDQLYTLATLVHAIARRLPAPEGLEPGPCTSLEIDVVRHIGAHPGCSAGAAAAAVGMPSSNFSRILKSLVRKGLVRREPDPDDARASRLYPTELAAANRRRMRDAWSGALAGSVRDQIELDGLVEVLARVDQHLAHDPQLPR